MNFLKCLFGAPVRAFAMFMLSAILLFNGITELLAQRRAMVDDGSGSAAISEEHRFSVLETKVDNMASAILQIKTDSEKTAKTDWLKMLALAGLIGEAGVRTIRKKPPV